MHSLTINEVHVLHVQCMCTCELLLLLLLLFYFSPPTVYSQAVKLLLSVSEFEITRRYWRDEVMELFLEPLFFTMDKNSIYK